jgi:hypothetical protein
VPTGPVDWMPLPPEPGAALPGAGSDPGAAPGTAAADGGPAASSAAARRRRVRLRLPAAPARPRGGRGSAAAVLGLVALLLLELGLLVHQSGKTLWATVPLWAGFATAAAVVGLTAVAGLRAAPAARDRAWGVGAGGLTGLAVFWLLVVLPTADTDRGFVLTAALACLGGCLWLTAGRSRAARPADPEVRQDETEEAKEAGDAAGAEDEVEPAGTPVA